MDDNNSRIVPSVTRIDRPKALAGKYSLSFTQKESTHSLSVNLTEDELIETLLTIGAYLDLNGIGDKP